jgi:hypothetical protein
MSTPLSDKLLPKCFSKNQSVESIINLTIVMRPARVQNFVQLIVILGNEQFGHKVKKRV